MRVCGSPAPEPMLIQLSVRLKTCLRKKYATQQSDHTYNGMVIWPREKGFWNVLERFSSPWLSRLGHLSVTFDTEDAWLLYGLWGGLSVPVLNWFNSYLSGRAFSMYISGWFIWSNPAQHAGVTSQINLNAFILLLRQDSHCQVLSYRSWCYVTSYCFQHLPLKQLEPVLNIKLPSSSFILKIIFWRNDVDLISTHLLFFIRSTITQSSSKDDDRSFIMETDGMRAKMLSSTDESLWMWMKATQDKLCTSRAE